MRRAARKDANHNEIATAFQRLGFTVADTSQLGSDFPDMVIARALKTALVEVKGEGGKLSEGQKRFRDSWNGLVFECRTLQDVLAVGRVMTDVNVEGG